VFYQFFIDSILDLKNMGNIEDYADISKMIKMRRKNKEHKEFLATFCLTETYKSFVDNLSINDGPINEDGIHIEEFLQIRKKKGNNNEKKIDEDNKTKITAIDPRMVEYDELEILYEGEN
jgi:hypothetical protein